MPRFSVTVVITTSGEITVEAKDRDEAIRLAQQKYAGFNSLEAPCIDVDFPDEGEFGGEGVEEVDEDEDD